MQETDRRKGEFLGAVGPDQSKVIMWLASNRRTIHGEISKTIDDADLFARVTARKLATARTHQLA